MFKLYRMLEDIVNQNNLIHYDELFSYQIKRYLKLYQKISKIFLPR